MLGTRELIDLYDELSERLGSGNLLELLTYANRIGDLESLLESIGMEELLDKNDDVAYIKKKVLVLGYSQVKADKLKSLVKKNGFANIEDFEFCLGYNEVKKFNFRKLRYSETFGAVIVGPQPHSTPGKFGSSSAIAEMEKHSDMYPRVIRCKNKRGDLEITSNSFKDALKKLEELIG